MTPASIPPSSSSPSPPDREELRKRDVKATLDYLKSDGAKWLRDLHADADELESQITDGAVTDRCNRLWDQWAKKYGELYERIQQSELYDKKLLRIQVDQMDAIFSALEACAAGEKDEARSQAKDAAELNWEIDARIVDLERDG